MDTPLLNYEIISSLEDESISESCFGTGKAWVKLNNAV